MSSNDVHSSFAFSSTIPSFTSLHSSYANADDLPVELVDEVFHIRADARHNEACLHGSECTNRLLCPEAQSPEPIVAQISSQWESIASRRPKLFSKIRVLINANFDPEVETDTIPVDNADEIAALKKLSGSEDVYLSIGGPPDPLTSPPLHQATPFTLAGIAERAVHLAFDIDNPALSRLIGNTFFPKLKSVHLDRTFKHELDLRKDPCGVDRSNLESLLLWHQSPIERIVSAHRLSVAIRAKLPWDTVTVMDFHGIVAGYKEPYVEMILNLAKNLVELRVHVNSRSKNYSIPHTSWSSTGNHPRRIVHPHLKILHINHSFSVRLPGARPPKPAFTLFKDANFPALQEIHYRCNDTPHDDSIGWLLQRRETVTSISLDAHLFRPQTLAIVLKAHSSAQKLYLWGRTPAEISSGFHYFDNATLEMLTCVGLPLKSVSLFGEASFTVGALSHFIRSFQETLQTIVLSHWCGPKPESVAALKETLDTVDFKVGQVYPCRQTRLTGVRTSRRRPSGGFHHVFRPRDRDGAREEHFLVFWCGACRLKHISRDIDLDAVESAHAPLIDERRQGFCYAD